MPLPPAMCAQLAAQQKFYPRFFFRGFTKISGGGDPRLNNKQGVTPHLFLEGSSVQRHSSVADFTPAELLHGLGDYLLPHLAVIDIKRLAVPTDVFYASDFHQVYGSATADPDCREILNDLDEDGLFFTYYEQEYLIHGKVRGPGYHVMKLPDATDRMPYKSGTLQEFVECREVAVYFNSRKSTRPCDLPLTSGLIAVNVTTIVSGLGAMSATSASPVVPDSFAREDWIMLNVVDTKTHLECSATIEMLRALTFNQLGESKVAELSAAHPVLEVAEPRPTFQEEARL